jgi:hypothetical protein
MKSPHEARALGPLAIAAADRIMPSASAKQGEHV